VTTELVLLGTAGAPAPVVGRAGISSAVVVDGRVFVVDCGRGSPSAFAGAGLDFARLEAVFLTHLHADHTGDLPGLLLYPWGVREPGAITGDEWVRRAGKGFTGMTTAGHDGLRRWLSSRSLGPVYGRLQCWSTPATAAARACTAGSSRRPSCSAR
jgi:glyoxylase-like metal-dependent hydrolase (beta-lactamase superfamily II)